MTSTSDMLTVQSRADDPLLVDLIANRKRSGMDLHDEWWNGTYRIVTGPSWEHGDLALRLGAILLPLADRANLRSAAPANIGVDKVEARVPDLAFAQIDVEMTSPAFASTAELVVEILSPGEVAGEKLAFYAQVGVEEYLEIDLTERSVRLLERHETQWETITTSGVLGFDIADVAALLDG